MKLKIDGLQAVANLAAAARATPDAVQRAAYRSINQVATKVQTDAVRTVASQLNLTVAYVRDKFALEKASRQNLLAVVKAGMRPIGLERFSATQLVAKAARAKGDVSRAIPAGRKQAGVSVKVSKTGARKKMPGAFLIPMRAGTEAGGNGKGVFIRTGKGRGDIKHLYGPSPDQLFSRYREENLPDIQRMLADAYASQLRFELKGTRK